jgi:hypothetical protein
VVVCKAIKTPAIALTEIKTNQAPAVATGVQSNTVVWSLPGSHLPLHVEALKIITPLLISLLIASSASCEQHCLLQRRIDSLMIIVIVGITIFMNTITVISIIISPTMSAYPTNMTATRLHTIVVLLPSIESPASSFLLEWMIVVLQFNSTSFILIALSLN